MESYGVYVVQLDRSMTGAGFGGRLLHMWESSVASFTYQR